MLDALISMSHVRPRIEEDASRLRPIDADLQIPDTSKFRKHTGWEPKINFRKTMSDLLNYWRGQIINKVPVLLR